VTAYLKKKSAYSFQVIFKKEDVVDDADEVRPVHHRTVYQQQSVLRNSSSGLSIYSSPLISA
jgi:hypothetical protein